MKLLDLPLAEKNMLSALDFAEKSNDLISIGCAYRGLGEILKSSDKAEDAAVYFEKAIIAFQKAGDTYGVEEVKRTHVKITSYFSKNMHVSFDSLLRFTCTLFQ